MFLQIYQRNKQKIECYEEEDQKQKLLPRQLGEQFVCNQSITECSLCHNLNSADQKSCKQCIYKNTKKIQYQDGTCQLLRPYLIFDVWGYMWGCDSSKCSCSKGRDNYFCSSCKDSDQVMYPDFGTCELNCKQGRFLKEKLCLLCDPNGQYLKWYEGCQFCKDSIPYCNECQQSNDEERLLICDKCQNGYFLDYLQNSCVECTLNGYIQVGKFCIKNPSGCQIITENSINLQNRTIQCDICTNSEAIKQSDGSCSECPKATYPNKKTNSCSPCKKGCLSCLQEDICTECDSFYNLINGQCIYKLQDCTAKDRNYEENGKCNQCQRGFYINDCTNFENFCGKCLPCKTADLTQVIINGQCVDCNLECATCRTLQTCQKCSQPGVILNPFNLCKCQDIKKCLMCTNTGCFKCPPDYEYDGKGCFSKNNQQPCPSTFQQINSENYTFCYCQSLNCKFCDYENGQNCVICQTGYALNRTTLQCEKCPPGSILDKAQQTCICSVSNCQLCQPNQVLKCQTCQPQYELTSQGFCKLCQLNYIYDVLNQKCKCQDNNCIICDPKNGNICLQCSYEDYILEGNICKKVQNKCIELDPVNPNLCKTCESQYSLNAQGQCKCKFDNCMGCQVSIDGKCSQCQSGFIWSDIDSKCICNIKNCQECNTQNNGECKTCILNYKMGNDYKSCDCDVIDCLHCNPINGKVCELCQTDLIRDQSGLACNKCQVRNCEKCQKDDSKKCQTCSQGYYSKKPFQGTFRH